MEVNKKVSHYKILEKLGGGGMGVVYKAEDTKLHRIVALKFLPPELIRDEESKKRFILEAQAASSLDHNNICVVHEIDEEEGQLFICMNYYEGETLKKKIGKGPLRTEEAINLTIQTASGLQEAHEKGINHRDIKPANLFLTDDGIIKILDFGLAKLTGYSVLTRVGETLGTTAYMSPEQSKGEKTDNRTDIWSLGIVLYEMLTGKLPFKGDYEQAVIYSILNDVPESVTSLRTGIPPELERIIGKAIAKNKDERYQHIDEMIVDLKKLLKDSESKSNEVHKIPAVQHKSFFGRYKKYFIPAAAIFLAAAVFLILKLFFTEDIFITEPTPIAVITFENQTGDESFDYLQKAIPNLLITNLEQSKYFRVTTWERMQDILNQMGKSNVSVINKDLGFDICKRDGVDIIVIGSYIKAGNMFATDIKVLDVATKQIIKSASSRGEGISSILESQIDDLSKEISRGIGISYSKIAAEKLRVIDVTTNSMDAYNYFLKGRDNYDKFYTEEARKNIEKAIEIDSTFATAHFYLSRVYSVFGETNKRNSALEKAYLFSEKATEKERLMINAYYASAIERNREKREQILKELVEKYPKEKLAHYELGVYYASWDMHNEAKEALNKALLLDPDYSAAINQIAYIYSELGEYKKAIDYLKKYSALNPKDANPFDSMADYYWIIGQHEAAIENYLKALDIKHDFFSSPAKLAYLFAEKENYKEVEKWINTAIDNAPSAGLKANFIWIRAFIKSWQGKIREAFEDLEIVRDLCRGTDNKNTEGGSYWQQAYIYFDMGEYEKSRQSCQTWFDYERKYFSADTTALRESNFLTGLINTRLNYIDSAKVKLAKFKSFISGWEKGSREDYRYNYLNAEILLAEKSAHKAIDFLNKSSPQSIINLNFPDIVIYNAPFMKDLLARAYLQAGETDNAIAEYEKLIIYNPKGKERYLIHPKYYYRLALLFERKGLKEKAIEKYKRFLELWKDADAGLFEVMDAKKRLSKLASKPG